MIEDPDLLQFLQIEENRATDTTLNQERETALDFYEGKPFGDEVDGRSKLVTRDVAEVVDYMLVSIMRTLVSGDRLVDFEPIAPILQEGPEGQRDITSEIAQQATERVHWNFLREQDGYAILHDGIKAGLLEKSGIWKSWKEQTHTEETVEMNADQLDSAGPEVLDARPIPDTGNDDHYEVVPWIYNGEPVLDALGQPMNTKVQLYEATVRVPGPVKFRDAAIPNDEFFVAPDARTLDTAAYVGNVSRVCLYELMEMGYTEEDVADLYDDNSDGQQLSDARDSGRTWRDRDIDRRDFHRIVTLREEYVRWWMQGRMRLVRVHRVANKILSVEPAAMQPYTLWSPFPRAHRLIGDSLADKVMDIQVVRSHMLRQAMDGLYLANAPRQYVDMTRADDTTIDDLLDVAPGGLVRGNGQDVVRPLSQPFTAEPAFNAMERMAGEKESRTGITRLNQGLDADALNKTATGTALMQASGQQIEEYVARNAANAIGELFEKKLQLFIVDMAPHMFRIDGEFKQIDPSMWPADMRIGVRVGLGTGNKDRRLQAVMMLKQTMAEAYEMDPKMVTPEKAFEAAKEFVSVLNFGTATRFFNDPNGDAYKQMAQGEQQQPDPAVIEAQMKSQERQQEMQFKREEGQLKLQLAREEAAAKLELEREKAAAEADLAMQRMDREYALKREEMMWKAANTNMTEQRPGGSLAS